MLLTPVQLCSISTSLERIILCIMDKRSQSSDWSNHNHHGAPTELFCVAQYWYFQNHHCVRNCQWHLKSTWTLFYQVMWIFPKSLFSLLSHMYHQLNQGTLTGNNNDTNFPKSTECSAAREHIKLLSCFSFLEDVKS